MYDSIKCLGGLFNVKDAIDSKYHKIRSYQSN